MIKIYTDGAYSSKSTLGGWGFIALNEDESFNNAEQALKIPNTTNQRMELSAAIGACRFAKEKWLRDEDEKIMIVSDSAYLVNCYRDKWYKKWMRSDWKTSKKEPVKNQDLWEELVPFFELFPNQIEFVHIKGHNGTTGNEFADRLATGELTVKKVEEVYNEQSN